MSPGIELYFPSPNIAQFFLFSFEFFFFLPSPLSPPKSQIKKQQQQHRKAKLVSIPFFTKNIHGIIRAISTYTVASNQFLCNSCEQFQLKAPEHTYPPFQ